MLNDVFPRKQEAGHTGCSLLLIRDGLQRELVLNQLESVIFVVFDRSLLCHAVQTAV